MPSSAPIDWPSSRSTICGEVSGGAALPGPLQTSAGYDQGSSGPASCCSSNSPSRAPGLPGSGNPHPLLTVLQPRGQLQQRQNSFPPPPSFPLPLNEYGIYQNGSYAAAAVARLRNFNASAAGSGGNIDSRSLTRDIVVSRSSVTGSNMFGINSTPSSAIYSLSKHSLNITECVPVSSSEHVAEIVGRQGSKIKALRTKTNTYIKTPVRNEEPVFVVTGRREDVACAKREILSAAEHFSQIRASRLSSRSMASSPSGASTRTAQAGLTTSGVDLLDIPSGQITIHVRVPYRVVGLVVGPKGATIKRIQQDSQTHILTPSRDHDPVFTITGLKENVEQARHEIESYIALRTHGSASADLGDTGRPPRDQNGEGEMGLEDGDEFCIMREGTVMGDGIEDHTRAASRINCVQRSDGNSFFGAGRSDVMPSFSCPTSMIGLCYGNGGPCKDVIPASYGCNMFGGAGQNGGNLGEDGGVGYGSRIISSMIFKQSEPGGGSGIRDQSSGFGNSFDSILLNNNNGSKFMNSFDIMHHQDHVMNNNNEGSGNYYNLANEGNCASAFLSIPSPAEASGMYNIGGSNCPLPSPSGGSTCPSIWSQAGSDDRDTTFPSTTIGGGRLFDNFSSLFLSDLLRGGGSGGGGAGTGQANSGGSDSWVSPTVGRHQDPGNNGLYSSNAGGVGWCQTGVRQCLTRESEAPAIGMLHCNTSATRRGSMGSIERSPSTSPSDSTYDPSSVSTVQGRGGAMVPVADSHVGVGSVRRCFLCADSDVVAALVPCGHNAFCMECAAKILNRPAEVDRKCPICLQHVTVTLRILP